MEFEGKYKVIYIGTAILIIVLFILYGVYFLKQNNVEETTNYTKVVNNNREEGLGIVLDETIETKKEEDNLSIVEEVIEEQPVVPKEDVAPKKSSKTKTSKKSNNSYVQPEYSEPTPAPVETPVVETMPDEIIDTTSPVVMPEPQPEPTPEQPVIPEPIVEEDIIAE